MDVAVLGAGTRGRGIAQLCAVAGHAVSLYGDDANAVMDAIDAVDAALGEADVSDVDREAAVDRIDATTGLEAAVGGAELVVETATSDRETARDRFAEVEAHVDDTTLLMTTHSALSVTAVATGLGLPDRAVGLHFLDPPETPLVEVVVAEQTAEATRKEAVSFVDGLDCESVVVRDTPGFAATRLELSLAVEAMRMVDEGVAGVRAIDRAMEQGQGHPVGPLAAADRAGLDARLEELDYLAAELGVGFEPPAILREKVAAGELGRKTGEGFYVWESGERVESAEPDPTARRPAGRGHDPDADRDHGRR